MVENNQNNLSCDYAEQIVSYLYAETKEKTKFEAHLANCPTCADEFAGFGFVRSSILEWREADFSNLESPTFDIPTMAKKNSFFAQTENSGSWFGNFWKQFTFSPAMTATALAALVVCVGLTLFTLNFSGGNDVAEKLNGEILTKATVSPTIEIVKEELKDNVADSESKKSLTNKSLKTLPENANPSELISHEKQIIQKNNVIKVSSNASKNNLDNSARNSRETNDVIKKPSTVRKKQVPSLIDVEDDEDDSIRLADLFAEVDTK